MRDLGTTSGVVRAWYDDHGWGVLGSPDTPGGCWAHHRRRTTASTPSGRR
ncbi:hypothetical protein [Nocardioides alkalitolerans]|nr:hypothetical protein [Nocardioides alkalitolerans]